jgi:hypothetical protein
VPGMPYNNPDPIADTIAIFKPSLGKYGGNRPLPRRCDARDKTGEQS